MAKVKGVDVLLYVNTGTGQAPIWTLVGGQKNATLEESADPIDVSSKESRAKEFEYGPYTWTLSCEGVYVLNDTALQALRDAVRDEKKVKVRIKEKDTFTLEGLAVVTSSELEAPDDDSATYSIELQGTGWLNENPTP